MNADKVASIGSAFLTVAMVTVVVSHPGSSRVIRAMGQAFAGSMRAAMGH